jgi:integrase/recombinase XerC
VSRSSGESPQARSPSLDITAAIAACIGELTSSDTMKARRAVPVWRRLETHLADRTPMMLGSVTPALAEGFIRSRTAAGLRPSPALTHHRRSSLRVLFRVARSLGLCDGDPTLDITVPSRAVNGARPLTDDEVAACRDAAVWSLSSARPGAAWALAETTARGAEIAAITFDDIDFETSTVAIHGGKRTTPRVGRLSPWGVAALERHGRTTGGLVYSGGDPSGAGQVATCRLISNVLIRAGLAGLNDVRPSSVAAWAGRRVFEETGRIELAAAALGVDRLDRAARIIGWDRSGT